MRNFKLGLGVIGACLFAATACGGDDEPGSGDSGSGGTSGSGGSAGASTSGGSAGSGATGGSTASGGTSSSTGGSAGTGGTTGGSGGSTGGTQATGGSGPGGNPAECPAAAPEDGTACSVDLGFNESCDYPDVSCDCDMGRPGGPGGAGATEEGEWECEEVAQCPATQPEGECSGNYPGGCEYDDVTCFCGGGGNWICPDFGGEGGGPGGPGFP